MEVGPCPQAAGAPLSPGELGAEVWEHGLGVSRPGLEEETEKAGPSQQAWPAAALWVWRPPPGWPPWSRKRQNAVRPCGPRHPGADRLFPVKQASGPGVSGARRFWPRPDCRGRRLPLLEPIPPSASVGAQGNLGFSAPLWVWPCLPEVIRVSQLGPPSVFHVRILKGSMICPKEHGRPKAGTKVFSSWAMKKSAASRLSNSLSEHSPWGQPSDRRGPEQSRSTPGPPVRSGLGRHPRLWEHQGGPAASQLLPEAPAGRRPGEGLVPVPNAAFSGSPGGGHPRRPHRASSEAQPRPLADLRPDTGHPHGYRTLFSTPLLCPGPTSGSCTPQWQDNTLPQLPVPEAPTKPGFVFPESATLAPGQHVRASAMNGHVGLSPLTARRSDKDGPESGGFLATTPHLPACPPEGPHPQHRVGSPPGRVTGSRGP